MDSLLLQLFFIHSAYQRRVQQASRYKPLALLYVTGHYATVDIYEALQAERSVNSFGYDPQTSHNTPLCDVHFHSFVYICVLYFDVSAQGITK